MSDCSPAQRTAVAVRDEMLVNDRVLRTLGIQVGEVGPGRAVVTMTVRADMLNGFAICHGGLVATLADTAFAYACNSYDELTVAAGFSMELLAPSHEGDVLTAVAIEQSKSGRMGVYDIEVNNQQQQCVALFRWRSYTMKGRPVIGGAPVRRDG